MRDYTFQVGQLVRDAQTRNHVYEVLERSMVDTTQMYVVKHVRNGAVYPATPEANLVPKD